MVLEQPPLALDETTQDIANAVPSVSPPPLEFGDFSELGLLSWTPAGFIRWTIEVIQVTTGMPWFHTIICATVLWRIVLVPISIKTLQNSARLLPMSNRLLAIKDEMAIAQKQRDKLALQRIMLKQQKIYSDAGVSMGPMIIAPFVQLPVTLGLFFGIKKICQLPLEQLKNSGLDILPDLTMADPYFILPTIAAIVINVQISVSIPYPLFTRNSLLFKVGAKEMNLVERPQMGHLMNLLRVVSITGIYFMGDLPSVSFAFIIDTKCECLIGSLKGLMISLITGVAATTLQSLALQYQPLRRWLDIPVVLPQHRGRLPSFKQSIDFVVKSVKEKQLEANRQAARQRRQ
jgi:YidC/Oxa1 family membrane protein insertase